MFTEKEKMELGKEEVDRPNHYKSLSALKYITLLSVLPHPQREGLEINSSCCQEFFLYKGLFRFILTSQIKAFSFKNGVFRSELGVFLEFSCGLLCQHTG